MPRGLCLRNAVAFLCLPRKLLGPIFTFSSLCEMIWLRSLSVQTSFVSNTTRVKLWASRHENWTLLNYFWNASSLKSFDNVSIFQTFSRSWKLLGEFQDFFKNSRFCTNPRAGNRLQTSRGLRPDLVKKKKSQPQTVTLTFHWRLL